MTEAEFRKNLGERIARYRKLNGMTQSAFAEKLGYSDKAVSKWERGESMPDLYTVTKIAEIFGTDVRELASGELSDERENYLSAAAKKERGRRVFIPLLSAGIVWLTCSVIFFILQIILNSVLHLNAAKLWIIFIYAIPISFVVLLVFACVWGRKWQQCVCVSGLLWGAVTSVYMSFHAAGFALESAKYIFIGAAVFQALTILWYLMKILFPKGSKQ